MSSINLRKKKSTDRSRMDNINIQQIIAISKQAGLRIMSIYQQSTFAVSVKSDKSFLTQADMDSHTLIVDALQRLYPSIPVISEESTEAHDYSVRKNWNVFFLVDPLDGTKEFVERNGEFTVNIALIQYGQPILGVIHAPAFDLTYFAEQEKGAYKIQNEQQIKLQPYMRKPGDPLRVAISRSYACEKTQDFLRNLEKAETNIVTCPSGSALKFGLVADGTADIYPRLTPTMEWDTAAGHVLINEVGKKLKRLDNDEVLRYNKQDLRNPGFIVR